MVFTKVPVAVIALCGSAKVCPAVTLKTIGFSIQTAFNQAIASLKLAKFVPAVGSVLSMV